MTLVIYHDQASDLPAVDIDGEIKLLAALPTPPDVRKMFRRLSDVEAVLPRSEIKAIDRSQLLGSSYIINQRSHGSCVGFACAGAFSRWRVMAGQTYQRLSGSFIYAWINGGRDNGSNIGESLNTLIKYGTCLESEADWDKIYPSRIPKTAYSTAYRFRCEEGYRVESYDEALTGITLGGTLVYACMVGGNFDNLDSEGVVGFDRGGGNHAISADGIYMSAKHGPCLDAINSWGTNWGVNGRMRTNEKQWNSVYQDAYILRAGTWDPLDPNVLPNA